MTKPDWLILACAVVTILLLGAHALSIAENIYYDPHLFWPFGLVLAILLSVVYLMFRVIAYELCGKSKE
jgi:NO-binding membrane sensor protein with MHYT domain